MKRIFLFLTPALLCILLLAGCKKDDEKAPETNTSTTPTVNKGSFGWQAANSASVTADSAFYYASFTTIYAFKNGLNTSIEINLSALSAGTYSLSSATGNDLTFVSGPATYTASSGSCNITAAANNKLSGTFSAALSGGTVTSISGSFYGHPEKIASEILPQISLMTRIKFYTPNFSVLTQICR